MMCIADFLCGADDVLLLQEIGQEVTGQTIETPRTSQNEEVSVRLVQARGTFWNGLAADDQGQWSLKGVRLVVAILRDSQVATSSAPSDPLVCRSTETNQQNAVEFEARWSHRGGILSFDRPSNDTSSIDFVIALVNGNETAEDFLLACPCGEAVLSLSQPKRNGDRRKIPIRGLPSPRNYVIFPSFNSNNQVRTSQAQDGTTAFNSHAEMEEKKSCESCGDLELPYLSLERASLSIEMSWQQKELDVEIYYTGEEKNNSHSKGSSQQEFVVDRRLQGYTPVRTHRLQKMKSDTEHLASVEESPIGVAVGVTDDEKTGELSTSIDGRTVPAEDNCGLVYQEGPELLDQAMRSLALDDEFRQASDDGKQLLLKQPPLPPSHSKRKIGQGTQLVMNTGHMEGKTMVRAASGDGSSSKPRRSWTDVFWKARSQSNQPTSSSLLTRNLDEGLLEDSYPDDENVASLQKSSLRNKDSASNSQEFIRKRLFADAQPKNCEPAHAEDKPPAVRPVSSRQGLHVDKSQTDEVPVLSTPDELQITAHRESANSDRLGGIYLLSSLCTTGDEVLTSDRPASEESRKLESLPQRDGSQLRKETGMAGVSQKRLEPVQQEHSSFAKMLQGALWTPPTLCSTLSDVTMDAPMERQKSMRKLRSIEHCRSFEELSRVSNKSDEITTMSKIEDRMIMRAYHAMGGKHLDRATDAILRKFIDMNSEREQSMRSNDESAYYSEEGMLSLDDIDFECAASGESKAVTVSRQLTTIAEETFESRELRTKSDSTETVSARSRDDHGLEIGEEGGVSSCTGEELLRSASF